MSTIDHPLGRGDNRLVTVHQNGRTIEGRVQWAHRDGTFNIDRFGFLPQPATAYSRVIRTRPDATIHAAVVRPLPCCDLVTLLQRLALADRRPNGHADNCACEECEG